ncbi:MAG TPA: hypothetical protein VFE27_10740 [Acidobacteriaceae bacterium]|nr:hypothetical protein [Acidobacteriaceae bacterium]
MKSNRCNSLLGWAILSSAVAVGLFASTGTAKAQNGPRVDLRIPFAFQVGSIQMPAGSYAMHVRFSHKIVQLDERGSRKPASVLLLGSPSEDYKIQSTGRLIFHQYGDQYFLREVWEGDGGMGVVSPPSREEKMLRHKQAATQRQLAFNANPTR